MKKHNKSKLQNNSVLEYHNSYLVTVINDYR